MKLTREQVLEYKNYRDQSLRSTIKPTRPSWLTENKDWIGVIIDQLLEIMENPLDFEPKTVYSKPMAPYKITPALNDMAIHNIVYG